MLLKSMGSADVRQFLPGDNAGGVMEPLTVAIVFDRSNNWIVDTEDPQYADVSSEWWDYLKDVQPDILDVTGYRRYPLNDNQKLFLGMQEGTQLTAKQEAAEREAEAARVAEEVLLANALATADDAAAGHATREELVAAARDLGVPAKGTKEELETAVRDEVDRRRREGVTAAVSEVPAPATPPDTVG